MTAVNVGIIGLGSWGECHAEAYRSLPQVRIAAVCDTREERLAEIGGRFGIEPDSRYTRYEEMLQRSDLDLVSVATFEKDHLAPTLMALATGNHVLVEKPVSTRLNEAKEMYDAAVRQGKYLMPGHLLRFDPRYMDIYRSIRRGGIGKPVSMYFKRSRQRSLFETYCRTHTVYELTVHDLDLALWYADSPVKSVQAYGRHVSGSAAPEVLWANLEFENGVLAVLHSNWMTPDEAGIAIHDSVEVIGDAGIAHFETANGGLQVWNRSGRLNPDFHIHHLADGILFGALRAQLQYVCSCILDGTAPVITSFPDAVRVIEAADAIVRSCETGKRIELG
jgi:UDP-N-acetylglucosamine 3-dehydrogenase